MLTQEMVVTIKVLKKQGKSIKGIAQETGVARNTVKKYLNQPSVEPSYNRSSKRLNPRYLRMLLRCSNKVASRSGTSTVRAGGKSSWLLR